MKFQFNQSNTFCINLDHRTDRWEMMKLVLDNNRLEAVRWSACTVENIKDLIYGKPSQKACSQSHINIWRHIVQTDLSYALILEDDICFYKGWRDVLESFPFNDYEIILLNTDHHYGEPRTWQQTQGDSWLSGAYILKKETAQALLSQPFAQADFMLLNHHRKTNNKLCFSYFPYLAIQNSMDSDIDGSLPIATYHNTIKQLNSAGYGVESYF